MNGFLVRHDGSMISIDHIVWIELSPIVTVSPTQYDIWIRTADYDMKWNQRPLGEVSANQQMQTLRKMLQDAIALS